MWKQIYADRQPWIWEGSHPAVAGGTAEEAEMPKEWEQGIVSSPGMETSRENGWKYLELSVEGGDRPITPVRLTLDAIDSQVSGGFHIWH